MKKNLNSALLYHDLLQMRVRPGMYIGKPEISVLANYLFGFRSATRSLDLPNKENPPFRLFNFWVQFKNPDIKYASWLKVLLKKNNEDDFAALKDFFKLFVPFSKLRIKTGYHAKTLGHTGKVTDVFIFGWSSGFYSHHHFRKPVKSWTDVYLLGGSLKSLTDEYPERFKKLTPIELKKASKFVLSLHDQDFGF